MALSSRAHAFSVEALIGSHKKRKLRDWDAKGLDLSMESLSPDGQLPDADDPAQCLDLNPGERGARRDGRGGGCPALRGPGGPKRHWVRESLSAATREVALLLTAGLCGRGED